MVVRRDAYAIVPHEKNHRVSRWVTANFDDFVVFVIVFDGVHDQIMEHHGHPHPVAMDHRQKGLNIDGDIPVWHDLQDQFGNLLNNLVDGLCLQVQCISAHSGILQQGF